MRCPAAKGPEDCAPASRPSKRIMVLTSTFPRWRDDKDPPFVFELCQRLRWNFRIQVLAPHAPGARVAEELEGLGVHRFRYFFEKGEVLAYGSDRGAGGILANLRRRPLSCLLVPLFMCAQLMTVVRMLRRQKFDLIHAHWLVPQGLVAVLARLLARSATPLVCTSHGADLFALRGFLWSRLKRRVIDSSSAITVVSRAMRMQLFEISDCRDKLKVIPMGVDLENRFVPIALRRKDKSLLFVGRLVEKKGLIYLIQAMPTVLRKHPDASLDIAGSGPEEASLRRLVSGLALEKKVRFVGALPNRDIPPLYQSSQIAVFPSIVAKDGDQEGFGLVLVEAMGCGCAVIASDLPAVRDIVIDGRTGLSVPEGDPEALARKIICLLDNPDFRSSLAEAGRSFVLERYDWSNIASRYEALFKELMICSKPDC